VTTAGNAIDRDSPPLNERYHMSSGELAGIDRGLGDAGRCGTQSIEEVRAAFGKFRRA
jgi:hypothetical protein